MRTKLLKELRRIAYDLYGAYFYDGWYYVGERDRLEYIAKNLRRNESVCLEGCQKFRSECESLDWLKCMRGNFIRAYVKRERLREMDKVKRYNAKVVNKYLSKE